MPTETWTIQSLIRTTRDLFAQRGIATARLDAELLLGHVLGLERMQLYTAMDRPVDDAERERFRDLVKRRARGEPVAYLLGSRGFWKGDFAVDRRVLIPRPETELLVELALQWVGEARDRAWRIVDVGTGSGALAVSLAMELPNATVLALDVSADALEVAAANATSNGVRERVKLRRGDLLDGLVDAGSTVDIVVSNPPYIGTDEGDRVEPAVREWEPSLALFAGRDGLELIRRLVEQAARVLAPDGLFVMEHGDLQGEATRALATAAFATSGHAVTTERDHSGLDRVLRVGRPVERREPPPRTPRAPPPPEPATGDGGGDDSAPPLPVIDIRAR